MTLVKYIAEKIIDSTQNPFSIYTTYLSNSTPHAYSFIYNNSFLPDEKKNLILNFYTKAKKHYNCFRKLSNIWKWKKYKKPDINTDLFLNKLSYFSSSQKICIMQKKTIYTFRLTDLLNIWEKALTASQATTPCPKNPMNPYTNIKFTVADLTNIFLKTCNSTLNIPIIISIYWKCFFNINKFRFEAYSYLKDVAIKNHINNNDTEILYFDIIEMVGHFKKELNGHTINYYPNILFKRLVIEKLKPILEDFLFGTESSNYVKKIFHYRRCRKNIRKFFIENPTFGRRVVVANRTINTSSSERSSERSSENSSPRSNMSMSSIEPSNSIVNDASSVETDNDIYDISNNLTNLSSNLNFLNNISGDLPEIPYDPETMNDPEINNIDFSNIFSETQEQSLDNLSEFSEESDISSHDSVS